MLTTGISLYMSTGFERNAEIIAKAAAAGARRVFTSLHIPEEAGSYPAQEVQYTMKACKEAGLNIFCDVSPNTLKLLGLKSFKELADLGVTSVRVDFGLDAAEIEEQTPCFDEVVLNASTLMSMARENPELLNPRFLACHNYYPKPYTGLSIESLRKTNEILHRFGIKTMGFVPGDKELRQPLYKGLPTVEEHRSCAHDLVANVLELYKAETDMVLIGDVDISDESWDAFAGLAKKRVGLSVELDPCYAYLAAVSHHDRPDPSEWVFRSQESRKCDIELLNTLYKDTQSRNVIESGFDGSAWTPATQSAVPAGTLLLSNPKYGRYAGEFEIARKSLVVGESQTIVGCVKQKDMRLLNLITDEFGIDLVI